MDFNVKWFIIGIGIGFVVSMILGMVFLAMYPPQSIEQICFESTLTSEDYEKCLSDLRLS
ncbi:hypothetical protein [Nitrosopumilus sp.]|uniref:hypothetical protein n=1 Tax=Nitrosopumilus sp. TaxID=2024843 RepID=UPI003B5AABC0